MSRVAGTTISDFSTYREPLCFKAAQILEYFLQSVRQEEDERLSRFALLHDTDFDPGKILRVCVTRRSESVMKFIERMDIGNNHFSTLTVAEVATLSANLHMADVFAWLNCLDFN